MEQLARGETGGGFFELPLRSSLSRGRHGQIQEELRNQYSLGYRPDRTAAGPGYHKVHVTVQRKGTVVQARDGYFANK